MIKKLGNKPYAPKWQQEEEILRLGLPRVHTPFGFPTQTVYAYFFSFTLSTCPSHLILDLIILITFDDEYKS
jgi:hypothetical protein